MLKALGRSKKPYVSLREGDMQMSEKAVLL